jgi:hypothetical protein
LIVANGSSESERGPRLQYGSDFYRGYGCVPDGNKMSFIYHRLPADG